MKDQIEIDQVLEVSTVLGSGKRTLLLFILNEKPMSYTDISKKFGKLEVGIGSSEVYKHLEILLRTKYIAKKGKVYLVTLKGKTLIDGLKNLVNTPPKVPKLEMIF
jgi:predicted transcriptional regulator